MTGSISGEAVRLDMPEAGLSSRTVALAIDLIVELILLLILMTAVGFAGSALDPAAAAAIGLVLVLAAILALPVALETALHGRTLGKLAMGIRVVRDDGGPVQFRHSLVRGIFLVLIDLWTTAGSVGLITSLANDRGKRVGDYFAGTIVVRDRFGARLPPPQYTEAVAPAVASWAQGVGLAALTPATASASASFLSRRFTLDPQARSETAAAIAADVAHQIGVVPPAPADSEGFLVAITQEKQRRDWQRGA